MIHGGATTKPLLLASIKLYLISVQSSPVKTLNKVNIVSLRLPYGSGDTTGAFGVSLKYSNKVIFVLSSAFSTVGSLNNETPIIPNRYMKIRKNINFAGTEGNNGNKYFDTDSLGNKYYQNKFDYPTILLTYQNSYIHNLDNPSGYGNGIFSPLGEKSYGKSKVYIENSVSNLENVDITSMSDATQSWAQGDPTLPGNKQASAPTQSWANGEPTTPGNGPASAPT